MEVDLNYPESLHGLHNDFPMAPERMTITKNMLSPYALNLYNQLNDHGTKPSSSEKLVSTFHPRKRYVAHYRNLKFYLTSGLNVSKVYRVITFKFRYKISIR